MNNIVGKLLVVLNLVFSLLFMCFAGAAYTFQEGWRKKAIDAQTKASSVEQAYNDEKKNHQEELESLQKVTVDLKNGKEQAEATLTQLQAGIQTKETELAQTQQQRDKHLADLQVAQAESEARLQETIVLRNETAKLVETVGQMIDQVRQKDDSNLGLSGQVAEARERELVTAKEIARLEDLLRSKKIDPRTQVVGKVPADIPKVDGKVLATLQNSSKSAEHVLISIGSDDKIVNGMILTVYSGDKYKGEVRITEARADEAVGLVVERSRNGIIERGDHVTTKL